MALLVKKFSFLPFITARAPGSGVEACIMARTFATRRSANKVPTVTVKGYDETTTDEDDDRPEDLEVQLDNAVQTIDDPTELSYIPCHVAMPINRRSWATSQDENALRFRMDMPGIAKENVKVYVDDSKLMVLGKYAQMKEVVDEDHILADNLGVYFAELELPDNVEVDKIKSQMKDGMLVVTAPKQVINVLVE